MLHPANFPMVYPGAMVIFTSRGGVHHPAMISRIFHGSDGKPQEDGVCNLVVFAVESGDVLTRGGATWLEGAATHADPVEAEPKVWRGVPGHWHFRISELL